MNPTTRLSFAAPAVLLACAAVAAGVPRDAPRAARNAPPDFVRDVRPVLATACLPCHGPDPATRKAGLRLDQPVSRAVAARIAERIALPPNDPAHMPPRAHSHAPTPAETELLKRWSAAGAPWSAHWAFRPIVLPKVPATGDVSPIDALLRTALRAKGLDLSPEADRRTLIRRASLDLIGLPPTPSEVEAFVADRKPGAWERVVDRLLASPRYGEHQARLWMDLARYADTKGYEKDLSRPMWRWRDLLIDALNADQPFDRFTEEQLAGDLLPGATPAQRVATAFHRMTMTNDEGGTDDEEFRQLAVKDRVDTTVQVWMGLTMGCAKCHTHKYDPISQTDYYRFYAIFNQTADADRFDDEPRQRAPTPAEQRTLDAARAALQSRLDSAESHPARADWERNRLARDPWRTPAPISARSLMGADVAISETGRIRVTGKETTTDTTVVELPAVPGAPVAALRLEVLPDPSLPGGGPGRGKVDPNAVVSEVRLEWVAPDGTTQSVPLAGAMADHEQGGWPVATAIDDNPESGWAWAPRNGEAHTAIFAVARPEARSTGTWRVTLDQKHIGYVLGSFRLSLTADVQLARTQPPSLDPIRILDHPADRRTQAERIDLADAFLLDTDPTASAEFQRAARDIRIAERTPVATPVMQELPEKSRRTTRLHRRGDFLDPGDPVEPAVLPGFGTRTGGAPDRLAVARWLLAKENPLTARVAVNRIWARIFGVGIVPTEEDFGLQGAAPSHPELLDWLADTFRTRWKWSTKALLRAIVLSRAYRQSARVAPVHRRIDPDNRLLSRSPRTRLPAEVVRDQALHAAGLLSDTLGGPPAMPPQPAGLWRTPYSDLVWETTPANRHRRGLYTFWRRTNPYPAMTTFDAGSGEVCTIRRIRTNTPLQALVTLNDPAFLEAAAVLGERMDDGGGVDGGIGIGVRRVLGRPPVPAETARLAALWRDALAEYRKHPDLARTLLATANRTPGKDTDVGRLAAWAVIGNVLLNLDEALVRP